MIFGIPLFNKQSASISQITDIQAYELNIDWATFRGFLSNGMPDMAYYRYVEWVRTVVTNGGAGRKLK